MFVRILFLCLSVSSFYCCSGKVLESELAASPTEKEGLPYFKEGLPYFDSSEIEDILRETEKTNSFTLLWFSDIHSDKSRLGRIVNFYELYSSSFNDLLHSGDNVDRQFDDGMSFWNEVIGTNRILNTIGNHDTASIINDSYDWKAKTGLQCFRQYFEPYLTNWIDVVFPVDASTAGRCYYYKDYPSQGVRLVTLDCMAMDSSSPKYDSYQLQWFEMVLTDARIQSLSVLVNIHCAPKSEPIDCSFTSLLFDSNGLFAGGYGGEDAFVKVVDAFIDDGGEFISWIAGDLHKDYIGYSRVAQNKQVVLVTACALCSPFASLTMRRVENTPSEDAFNILMVDTKRKNIKLKRVGATIDIDLKSHSIVSYNYDDHVLIESR